MVVLSPVGPGPVESGVQEEIQGLASEARPGLAQAALALARVLDNPKAASSSAGGGPAVGGDSRQRCRSGRSAAASSP